MELELEEVTVEYGTVVALEKLSIRFAEGSHTVVCGRAGCGKTTLLKTLAGLVRPHSGRVLWSRTDAATLDVVARRRAQGHFGMVFQSDALFDSLSVRDNVELPLIKRGVSPDEAHTRCDEALRQVGLLDAAAKRPEHLSGGMRKRTGIARAIVAKPQVLFADDPFAGLDPDTEKSIAELLVEVSQGCTLLCALPDPFEAVHLGRTLRLEAGHLTEVAP